MGTLNDRDINSLVKAARDNLADAIAAQAIGKLDGSDPIEFDVHVKIGYDDKPSANYQAAETCIYICYIIGGDIRCFRYCFNEPIT